MRKALCDLNHKGVAMPKDDENEYLANLNPHFLNKLQQQEHEVEITKPVKGRRSSLYWRLISDTVQQRRKGTK
jgi:hypothetical protein